MVGYKNMKTTLNLNHQLPFVQLRIWYKGQSLLLDRVLVDTGSASTIFKLDIVEKIGIAPEQDDIVGSISGVGGSEYIFLKQIDSIDLNGLHITNFIVNIGVMDYSLEINGIIGMDFLLKVKGIIDLNELILESKLSDE